MSAFYRISDGSIFDLCKHVCGGLQRTFDRQKKAFQTVEF
jgi:hypothetical protein